MGRPWSCWFSSPPSPGLDGRPAGAAADQALTGIEDGAGLRSVTLLSDGATRFVEFGLGDWRTLLALLGTEGINPVTLTAPMTRTATGRLTWIAPSAKPTARLSTLSASPVTSK